MQLKRVVITGLGGITPLGNSVTEFWNNLIKGVSGAANITRFNAEKFKTRFACEVKGFNLDDYFDKKEARKLDAYSQYGIAASVQAVADSGIAGDSIDKNEVGVIWGSGIGGLDTFQTETFAFATSNCIDSLFSNQIGFGIHGALGGELLRSRLGGRDRRPGLPGGGARIPALAHD